VDFLGCGHNELGAQLLRRWMFPPQLVAMVQEHHDYQHIAFCERSSQILMLADLLSRLFVAKKPETRDEELEEVFQTQLLRCGADSTLIPDEKGLARLEERYGKKLEERAELIELLQM